MDKEVIIQILSTWNFWGKEQEIGIWRERYLSKLEKLLQTDQIVALTGIRRSGKSTLMKQFIKRGILRGEKPTNFLYVNLEEPKFFDLLTDRFLQQIYDAYLEIVKPDSKPYLLLDEVQNIQQWERFVRGLHEKKEAHLIVSSSTSKLLSTELGTILTGRWLQLEVFPLDFNEYLSFNNIKTNTKLDILSQKIKIKQLLRDYLEKGGFPLVVLKKEKEEILTRYFEDIIGRDIIDRYNIRKPNKVKTLAKYYLTNFSARCSYRRISKFIGISLDTVERFSTYLTNAYLIFFIPKFSYSIKEQEINPRKVYSIDQGIINTLSFRFSENLGRLYENTVFLSLLQNGKDIYYYNDKVECDFIIRRGKKIEEAIQVSYLLEDNKEREIKGLINAMSNLKINLGIIITEDSEGKEKINNKNIRYVPMWKWLLEERLK